MLNERQSVILSYITEHVEARNSDLLPLIGSCSPMTLWRDLDKLEKEGSIVRVRGGAMLSQRPKIAGLESAFSERIHQNTVAKERIAKIAAALFRSNHAYYLDAGSTVAALTRRLKAGNYTILTSAANIAAELALSTRFNVTLLGGQVSPNTLSCSGPQAESMLDGMNIDVAVMATSGYSVNSGFTVGSLQEAQLKQKIIQKAAFSVMLLDAGKIGKNHPFTFASLADIGVLICDQAPSADVLKAAVAAKTQIFTPEDQLSPEQRESVYQCLLQRENP
ncbi:putative DeoR family transcriptional regulator [Oscillibacter valericigenes Sjm18-20]|nr:putative DeoR family transcriptional regulator [Oscillibacter valericigenes Sjm18-20]